MKIVADENIPLVQEYFADNATVLLKPGRTITQHDLIDADILLTRSITQVDATLLQNTRVKFVGSTTTGSDHIDTAWLDAQGIHWYVAKDCNATAVVEYVLCVLAALQKMGFLNGNKLRAGVIGAGYIGSLVAERLKLLGFEVTLCDPFRKDIDAIPLSEIADLDFISVHTPLTETGPHPTYHFIDKNFLSRQKKNCVLLNAARGKVISFEDLKSHGKHLLWCLDVWENEPMIEGDVMSRSIISTPHIAGYSIQSKYRGIEMVYLAALSKKIIPQQVLPKWSYPRTTITFKGQRVSWRDVLLAVFNPLVTTQQMKESLRHDPNVFDQLRKNFNWRYEFGYVDLRDLILDETDQALLSQFGFGL